MIKNNSGVKRPVLYFIVAVFGIALAVPLAASSGQMAGGGIFDECFETSCTSSPRLADAR